VQQHATSVIRRNSPECHGHRATRATIPVAARNDPALVILDMHLPPARPPAHPSARDRFPIIIAAVRESTTRTSEGADTPRYRDSSCMLSS